MPREIWKAVPGFEGSYEVSNRGRVRSLDRWIEMPECVVRGFVRKAHMRFRPGQMLAPGRCPSGHVTVALCRPGDGNKGRTRHIHALVMLAFVGPPPEGLEILHLNHTPNDNRRKNLKYGTMSENMKMDYSIGKRHGWSWINARGGRWANRKAA